VTPEPARVRICDVGPRDGLQDHPQTFAPAVRAELAARLGATGVARVEVASFVHPARVPQMAGAEEVVAALPADAAVEWSGLVLNERGYDRALAAGLARVNYTLAATEAFAQRNQGASVDAAVATGERLAERARRDGIGLTVTIAVSFGCPFEGAVDPCAVVGLAERVVRAGVDEVVLADTIGIGVPAQVRQFAGALDGLPATLGFHFHDTRRTGVANAIAAVECGVELLDASVGGLGGCPFAPGATGNVATEDVVRAMGAMRVETGVSLDALHACAAWLNDRTAEEAAVHV
jgi:(R)-citramalyl-CoA lyase